VIKYTLQNEIRHETGNRDSVCLYSGPTGFSLLESLVRDAFILFLSESIMDRVISNVHDDVA